MYTSAVRVLVCADMSVAVFTITRNESFFLPIWANYYTQFGWDVYVLDNSTKDNSVFLMKQKHKGINVHSVPSDRAFNHTWLRDVVCSFQRDLLNRYTTVIFAETDEFLVSSRGSLGDLVDAFDADQNSQWAIRASGLSVVHQFEIENSLLNATIGTSVLADRSVAFEYPSPKGHALYDKSLICKKPAMWSKGFHVIKNKESDRDLDYTVINAMQPKKHPDLYLLHLQQVDIDVYIQRFLQRKLVKSLEGFHGWSEAEQVKEFFKSGCCVWEKRQPMMVDVNKPFSILPHWKNLLFT